MPTPLRQFLTLVDWLRTWRLPDFDFTLGSLQVDRDENGWGVDAWFGMFASRGRVEAIEGYSSDPDAPEVTARVLCDHALRAVIVDAVERGRNGDDPTEAAEAMIREMEMDEIADGVEEGSQP